MPDVGGTQSGQLSFSRTVSIIPLTRRAFQRRPHVLAEFGAGDCCRNTRKSSEGGVSRRVSKPARTSQEERYAMNEISNIVPLREANHRLITSSPKIPHSFGKGYSASQSLVRLGAFVALIPKTLPVTAPKFVILAVS